MLSKVNYVINKAIDKACPLSKAKEIDPNNPWWTPELKQLRKEVTAAYDRFKNDKKNDVLNKYYKRKQSL